MIFQYAYPTDAHPVPVNSGFYASTRSSATGLEAECRGFLSQFPREVAMETLEFL